MQSFRTGKFVVGEDLVPDDLNLRSQTPISRESCFALGFSAVDLLGPDSENHPQYRPKRSEEEQVLLRGDQIIRQNKVQEQCDRQIRARTHSRRNRGPRSVTNQEFFVRIIEERKKVVKEENVRKKQLHTTLQRNAENFRQAQVREHVRRRLAQDKPIIETAIKDDVVNRYSKTFSHAIVLRSGAIKDAQYEHTDKNSEKYRYERQLEHGAFPLATMRESAENNDGEDDTNKTSRKESKHELFARLYAPSDSSKTKDVDLELELAKFRADMQLTEQREKMLLRADEHANRLVHAKKLKQQEHEQRVLKQAKGYRRSIQYERFLTDKKKENIDAFKNKTSLAHKNVQERNEGFHRERQTYREVLKQRTEKKLNDAEQLRMEMMKGTEAHAHRAGILRSVLEKKESLATEDMERRSQVNNALFSKLERADMTRGEIEMTHRERQRREQDDYDAKKSAVDGRLELAAALLQGHRTVIEEAQRRSAAQVAATQQQERELRQAYTNKRALRRELYEQRMQQKQRQIEYEQQVNEQKLAHDRNTNEKNRQQNEAVRVERERLHADSQKRLQQLQRGVHTVSNSHRLGQVNKDNLGHPDDLSMFLIERSAGLR